MINCVTHFSSIQRCFGEGRSTGKCYILQKLGKTFKEARNLSVPGELWALPSQTVRVHGEQEAQFYVQVDASCVTIPGQSTGL